MAWYWIVILTLVCFWTVSIILGQFDDDYVLMWAGGLLFPLLRVLVYPIRAAQQYEKARDFYEKHGITKMQFVLGKRARKVN